MAGPRTDSVEQDPVELKIVPVACVLMAVMRCVMCWSEVWKLNCPHNTHAMKERRREDRKGNKHVKSLSIDAEVQDSSTSTDEGDEGQRVVCLRCQLLALGESIGVDFATMVCCVVLRCAGRKGKKASTGVAWLVASLFQHLPFSEVKSATI